MKTIEKTEQILFDELFKNGVDVSIAFVDKGKFAANLKLIDTLTGEVLIQGSGSSVQEVLPKLVCKLAVTNFNYMSVN